MIRRAQAKDAAKIMDLLVQVNWVHHVGRPDLFKAATKYSEEELADLMKDDRKPIFVYTDDQDQVEGYAFCVFKQQLNDIMVTDIKTLYIDDLCVDEHKRGQHIGEALYHYVLDYAKESGCYNVTLNVWSCNPGAMAFYEKVGLVPQKVGMEKIL